MRVRTEPIEGRSKNGMGRKKLRKNGTKKQKTPWFCYLKTNYILLIKKLCVFNQKTPLSRVIIA
jgi:hypothetical protein